MQTIELSKPFYEAQARLYFPQGSKTNYNLWYYRDKFSAEVHAETIGGQVAETSKNEIWRVSHPA